MERTVHNEEQRTEKSRARLWMIVAAALAGGFLALLGVVDSMYARVGLAVLGGAFVGVTLYFFGSLHRS